MKRTLFFIFFIVVNVLNANAQAVASTGNDQSMTLFYVVVGLGFIVLLLLLAVAIHMLSILNALTQSVEKERAAKEGVAYKPSVSFWQNLWNKSNDFVELEEEETILREHSYDGIRELDNHLPPWWTGLLYVTIVFSFFYIILYHVTDTLPLQDEEYKNEVVELERMVKASMVSGQADGGTAAIDVNTVQVTTDAAALADGKSTFMSICASCHRPDGGGDIGPNLTDEYWKTGGSIQDIFKVIKEGVPNTNMISWDGQFSPEKMSNVANYILTLKGTNPENPKAPEGELYVPEVQQAADSVSTSSL